MQSLLAEMSLHSVSTLSHSICELGLAYAAKHGAQELLEHIQHAIDIASSSGDQESALIELATRIFGVSGAAYLSVVDLSAGGLATRNNEIQGDCEIAL